jgi:hypothetical protein
MNRLSEQILDPIEKIVERSKTDITNTQAHDCPLSWFGTSTSIKSGGVKGVSYTTAR